MLKIYIHDSNVTFYERNMCVFRVLVYVCACDERESGYPEARLEE